MDKTTIQLPVMNSATIASWYCNRRRKQEKRVLEQGICPPEATVVSPESLPPAVERMDRPCVPKSSVANPHVFVLPPNTAGMANLKKRGHLPVAPSAGIGVPFLAALEPPFQLHNPALQPLLLPPRLLLPASQPLVPVVLSSPSVIAVPYTTQQYHKKKQQEEEHSGKRKRSYTRKTEVITCKQCKRERDPATHHQYFGNWYCQATATMTLADWRATLEACGYGRKKDAPP